MTKLTKTITKNIIKTIDKVFLIHNASVTLHDVTPFVDVIVKEISLVNYVNSLIYLFVLYSVY